MRLTRTLPAMLVFAFSLALAAANSPFVPAGNMNVPRMGHTATLLTDGRVLIAGGAVSFQPDVTESAELYDPATGSFTLTGNLNQGRVNAEATLLPDGRVLIIGGYALAPAPPETGNSLASAEIYDPASGTFTRRGSLKIGRYNHTITLLPNGKVLVIGGITFGDTSPEVYDPTTGTSEPTGQPLVDPYVGFTTTALPNGKVLIISGTSEIYNPATNAFEPVSADLAVPRWFQSATLLSNGKVLIAGGRTNAYGPGPNPTDVADAFLYDSATGSYTPTGSLVRPRTYHRATRLANGNVLITGAFYTERDAEIYDVGTGKFSAAGNLITGRSTSSVTALPNGKALIAGGEINSPDSLRSTELYDPTAIEPIIDPAHIPTMSDWVLALFAMTIVSAAFWRRQLT